MTKQSRNNKKKNGPMRNRPGGAPRAPNPVLTSGYKHRKASFTSVSTPTSVSGCVVGQMTKKTRFSRTFQEVLSWAPEAQDRVAIICLQPGQTGGNYDPFPTEAGSCLMVGTPFPTAPPTATQYNMWRFVRPPKLHFVTNLNFAQQAQLRVAFNPDARSSFELGFEDLSRLDGTMSCPANLNSCYTVQADTNWRYINTNPLSIIDPRWTDAGVVYISTQGVIDTKILTAYWDFEIEFGQFVGSESSNNNDSTRGHMTMLRDQDVLHVVGPNSNALPLGRFAPTSAEDLVENQLQFRPENPDQVLANYDGVRATRPGIVCAIYCFIPALEGVTSTTIRMLKNGLEVAAKFIPTFLQGGEYSIQCVIRVAANDLIEVICDNPSWTVAAGQLLLTAL